MQIGQDVNLDLWFRYVDELPTLTSSLVSGALPLPSYTTLDINLEWRPTRQMTLSLVAQDLLGSHGEFASEFLGSVPQEIDASVLGKLEWRF
ncbi:MAG: hypothetical protein QNJ40_16695 [Xanthomonadales bacterium]|nr:hypothetical protein [Xanthomonadales bacterium]